MKTKKQLKAEKLERAKKNPKSTYWGEKADREITRLSKGVPCIVCGTTHNTCYHHMIPKGRSATHRHNLANLISLCPKHHIGGSEMCPHGTSQNVIDRFNGWMKENEPERWAWLQEHEFDRGKIDYRSAYEELSEMH